MGGVLKMGVEGDGTLTRWTTLSPAQRIVSESRTGMGDMATRFVTVNNERDKR